MRRDPVDDFFNTARYYGAVAGPFPSQRDARIFRLRASAARRKARKAGDHSLDHLVLRVTKENCVTAEPLAVPPIRPLVRP